MKKLLILFGFLVSVLSTQAQEKYFYVNLDINTPLSNTSWLKYESAHGGKAGYRVFINERFSAGVDFGWTTFNQYFPTETFENSSGAITTDYYNYIYSYSFAASGQYNFKMVGKYFYPYAGLGLGAMRNEYRVYYNIYEEAERSVGFLARPEAGVLVRVFERKSLGLMAAVHYDYSTNKSKSYDYSNFTSFGVQFGIILMDW